jgi:hypothetical protein
MIISKRNKPAYFFSVLAFYLSLLVCATSIYGILKMAQIGAVNDFTMLFRYVTFTFAPLFWYHLTEVYKNGDYKIVAKKKQLWECKNTRTGNIKHVRADTEHELELYFELTYPEDHYIFVESNIIFEDFGILIPSNSELHEKVSRNNTESQPT